MIKIFTVCTLTVFTIQARAEIDSLRDYRNLKTREYHAAGTYEVRNGEMRECTPCIMRFFNKADVLHSEGEFYTDCGVGWYKEFYDNGKTKVIGEYKRNGSGNWDDLWNRNLCSVRHGKWFYLNLKGDTLYTEFWNNGQFVRQDPPQEESDIWSLDLKLNGSLVDTQAISLNEVRSLSIHPHFKNANQDTSDLTVTLIFLSFPEFRKDLTPATLKTLDIPQLLKEAGIAPESKRSGLLQINYKGKTIATYRLQYTR